VTEGDVVHEHIGILKDYTADFLEILDVHCPTRLRFRCAPKRSAVQNRT
jgi:hypothetical protein